MKQSLINLILFSNRRKELLFLLREEPKDIDTIKELLNVDAGAIQPHIKKMKDAHLILEEKKIYSLSEIGKIIVENMESLLNTIEIFEVNGDHWKTCDLTRIPDFLLERIDELGRCELLEPDAEHLFETPKDFLEEFLSSKEILTFVSYFHPEAPSLYADVAEKGTKQVLCMTENVIERLFSSFPEEADRLSKNKNFKMFVCRKPAPLSSIVVTDRFLALKLFENDGKFRDQMLIATGEKALGWGKELFWHLMKGAEPLEEKPGF
ncbi:MAG: winged helix-turn-helix domain-containing protein [Methanosarcina sp.]|uniref:helix-turn-helix transcriptional regulator n=1 Tax=Methanosarcina sp. TaxID=2213 RepID=UPI0026208473|nr:winged helix-turn-helix domain-containing protein [Methanosarcina sp.]MDD3248619.1 winged helix-turn-helix domain-containing protein [Methanosarcina sp.]MDD4248679.1 winged helix-turn-helix domain-containing protein [Methanosarcina sp.]